MIEFEHIINESEANTKYINLTDLACRKWGAAIAPDGSTVKVVDGRGRHFAMKRHGGNQLTGCTEWFRQNNVQAKTRVSVKFDSKSGLLHLTPISPLPSVQRLPVGSLCFRSEGKAYEIQCVVEGPTVIVRGVVDGKLIREFEF